MVSGSSGARQTGLYPITDSLSGDVQGFSANGTQYAEGHATKFAPTKPVAYPSYTTTERNALTPAAGWVLYNSTDSKLQVYNGATWDNMH